MNGKYWDPEQYFDISKFEKDVINEQTNNAHKKKYIQNSKKIIGVIKYK